MTPKKKQNNRKKPGPKPEMLKVEGDWKDAMKHAMKKGPYPSGKGKK